MTVLGGIGFSAPWLLLGLIALPILWLILRAIPPAPIRERFPGVALLLGLTDDETVTDRTPWWLLLLRMLAVAAIILGLAGPVMNPQTDTAGDGPLLVVLDGSWAGANRWQDKMNVVEDELSAARQAGRTVAFLKLTAPEPPVFQTADVARTRLLALTPEPWMPSPALLDQAIEVTADAEAFDTVWLSDGLSYENASTLLAALETKGSVRVFETGASTLALGPATVVDGTLSVPVLRSAQGPRTEVTLHANGRDPAGNPAVLASATATFTAGETQAQTELSLPTELRARVTHFELANQRSAGAISLTDDSALPDRSTVAQRGPVARCTQRRAACQSQRGHFG